MVIKSQIYIGMGGIKNSQVKRTAKAVNCSDTVVLIDRKGNITEIEAEVVWNSLLSLAATFDLTPEAYIGRMRQILEEENKND